MKNIEKPKVFISYCWSNDDYVVKVVDFANRLIGDGIDVLLDQFEMKLGNDMNNFMEKCVNDENITNVLILLSPDYKTKSDSRTGGAGIETQIISGEVYSNVENTKFIPILFEKRGEASSACIPTYLKQRRYLDMSEDSDYEVQYIELVKTLYGRDKFIKNSLGGKPDWIDNQDNSPKQTQILVNSYKALRKEYGSERATFVSFDSITKAIVEIRSSYGGMTSFEYEEFDKYYKLFDDVKFPYLSLLDEIKYDKLVGKKLHSFYSDLFNLLNESKSDYPIFIIFFKILLHELLIETVSILFKAHNYEEINNFVCTPYVNFYSYKRELSYFHEMFYSLGDSQIYNLSEFLGRYLHKDGAQGGHYYCGITEYWIRNLPVKFINKYDFANADCLLTNISILVTGDYWFALSYLYLDRRESSLIKEIATSLKSRRLSKDYYVLFDTNKDCMKKAMEIMAEYSNKHEMRLGYNGAWDTIPLITNYLSIDDLESSK